MSKNNRICTIYILKNTANTKVYIGQTWQNLQKRWSYGNGYKDCPLLWNAICKYGKDSFYYEKLNEVTTQKEADDLEFKYITKYNSNNRKYGYNIKEGGLGSKHSTQTTKKMSLINHDAKNDEPKYFANEEEKFLSKIEKQNDCWFWIKALNSNGEGRYSTNYYGKQIEYKHINFHIYFMWEILKKIHLYVTRAVIIIA